jgi:hypothetical protein
MEVVLAYPVEIALRTLDEEDRRRVLAWLGHLENWEGDPFVREHSHKLPSAEDVYVLKTSADLWIFFKLEPARIVVLDVAATATLERFAQAPEPSQP